MKGSSFVLEINNGLRQKKGGDVASLEETTRNDKEA